MMTAPLHVFPIVITSRDGATTDVAVLIDAVRKAYRRRQVRLPTGLDLFALAREVDRVLIKYASLSIWGAVDGTTWRSAAKSCSRRGQWRTSPASCPATRPEDPRLGKSIGLPASATSPAFKNG